MATVQDSYDRLARETSRPCYSVTFWRTVNGFWGARAGIGTTEFGPTIDHAIMLAVDNAVAAQKLRADGQQEDKS